MDLVVVVVAVVVDLVVVVVAVAACCVALSDPLCRSTRTDCAEIHNAAVSRLLPNLSLQMHTQERK